MSAPLVSAAQRAPLKIALDHVRASCDMAARRASDPVEIVHEYTDADDREIVALATSALAFGNAATIRAKARELFARAGPSPAGAADDPRALKKKLIGFRHRLFRGEDLAGLLIGARRVQRSEGSLGRAFATDLDASPDLREALARFCDRIRSEGGFTRAGTLARGARRGPAHLLPDPRAGSASKRLLLFLRWMIRGADGVNLGLWDVPASRLVIPVDTHIHKLARNLGLTRRNDASWKTAEEITRGLAEFDPNDPVKYDFSLCHLGMLQRCPSRRDPARCEGCPVMPVCRHWRLQEQRSPANSPAQRAERSKVSTKRGSL